MNNRLFANDVLISIHKKGWSLRRLCLECGVMSTTLSRLLGHGQGVTVSNFMAIAKTLNLSLDWYMYNDGSSDAQKVYRTFVPSHSASCTSC